MNRYEIESGDCSWLVGWLVGALCLVGWGSVFCFCVFLVQILIKGYKRLVYHSLQVGQKFLNGNNIF